MPKRVLVIEDSADLAEALRYNLELDGLEVEVADDGAAGLEAARRAAPDLLILDLMLPRVDGFEVLRRLRLEGFDGPVLILSAKSEEADKVRGFRLGADQYLTKPFGLLELLERVKGLLARHDSEVGSDQVGRPHETLQFGNVTVDLEAHDVHRAGKRVHLSPRAFQLLVALLRREGRVASRFDLLRDVWGFQRPVSSRTVDAHVAELRRKLEADPSTPRHILTVWGVGYRLDP